MASGDLPIKKIYIDSKFRRKDSVSSSNFKIDLPYTLKLGENTVFYVDDVCVPHTWHTVEQNINDKLYLRLTVNNVDTDYLITLNPQTYNGSQLASEIDTQIKTGIFNGNALVPTVSYNSQNETISLSVSGFDCKILTDYELKTLTWGGTSYNKNDLQSVNELLSNNENTSTTGTVSTPVEFYLNLQPVRNIYLRSPNISSFSTIGCNGESSIIKKIPVTSNYGGMVFSTVTSGSDFLDCSKQTWKTLEFHLLDVNSNYINLHGSNVSFSIVLDKDLN